MFLLVMILDKIENLENILVKFREIGVTGATVLDSIGVGRSTLYGSDAPIIANLRRIFDSDSKTYNKTLLSIINTQEILENALSAAQEICGDFTKPDVGIMFWIKLDCVVGFNVPEQCRID